MDDLIIKSRYFITIVISLSLGFYISYLVFDTSSTENSLRYSEVGNNLRSLEQQINSINDSLRMLIEGNNNNNLTFKLDSPNEESMSSVNLKEMIKEIIHEEFNKIYQKDNVTSEDNTRVWELISQVQDSSVTSDFFQSKEINELPSKQKEMVVSEIIGRINRGEIDADRFFSAER